MTLLCATQLLKYLILTTGNEEKITITNDQNRLTPEDVERMVKEAEKFADEDAKLKVQHTKYHIHP